MLHGAQLNELGIYTKALDWTPERPDQMATLEQQIPLPSNNRGGVCRVTLPRKTCFLSLLYSQIKEKHC